ncbi:MAG: ATP-binding protein [Zoogloea oleivorans]|jgi:predicted AAA+ superfamily ATPase|uniref:ATP-binding protein n=1 Tax=Zoogloea oleivorans TaxID=1552750 RepID=UPI002A35D9C8|nr:ATP-binding protein [Zoogloea oleivorans]MDY0038528.1 ATP-binding protein [Zoogloea oleivorans]
MSSMESQYRDVVRQKIVDGLAAPLPVLTRRDIRLPKIRNKAVAVIGMRRSGKTSFLWQELAHRHAAGGERDGLLYVSFEDERLAGMSARELDLVVEEYYRLNPDWRDRRRATFFLDEIQSVSGWEGFARRLLDSEKIDLFLSGSSAKLLSREVATSMRGRAIEAVVYPFSFREYLRHHGREPKKQVDRLTKAERSALDRHLHDYLEVGGFPEAQSLDVRDRLDLMKGYVDVVLLRDIIERHAVSHPLALRWLVRQLLGNPAGSFSINKFYGDLKSQGIAVAKDTLHGYLAHLEDAFLVRVVSLATDSERRRMVNPRKVYPIDPGLIPIFDRSGKSNLGHALETSVLLELERRGAEVGYVHTRDGHEVDFLARYPEGGEQLIQVCASLDDPATQEREMRALIEASADYPRAARCLIAIDIPAAMNVPDGITLHRAADWLLSGDE